MFSNSDHWRELHQSEKGKGREESINQGEKRREEKRREEKSNSS